MEHEPTHILILFNLSSLGLILRGDTLVPKATSTLEDVFYVLTLESTEDEAPGHQTWDYNLE